MTQRSSATSHPGHGAKPERARETANPGDASLLGTAFAHALARNDYRELGELLHSDIEFRALTPRRAWAPENHSEALEVLRTWFGDCDIEHVVRLDTDAFADRQRVAYRFRGRRPDGPFVIEQQAYFCERAGQIDWMRVLCSGFRVP